LLRTDTDTSSDTAVGVEVWGAEGVGGVVEDELRRRRRQRVCRPSESLTMRSARLRPLRPA